MKSREIRELTDAEIRTKIDDARAELFNLRFQRATRQLSNTARFRQVSRDIARLETILHERLLGLRA